MEFRKEERAQIQSALWFSTPPAPTHPPKIFHFCQVECSNLALFFYSVVTFFLNKYYIFEIFNFIYSIRSAINSETHPQVIASLTAISTHVHPSCQLTWKHCPYTLWLIYSQLSELVWSLSKRFFYCPFKIINYLCFTFFRNKIKNKTMKWLQIKNKYNSNSCKSLNKD